ncbi:HSP20 family protein [Amphiplicatus metriothermophilus]|uniref:HSP20 family protein n=2 Tax=Amphiplicatus metriothermophilus TaxID=1519374 RepID=A0A239PQK6_9PROT|nr:HSP20 family protein [Amphiplicatus metriothermophilus]
MWSLYDRGPDWGGFGWDPFAEFRRLQNEVNRLFEDLSGFDAPGEVARAGVYPPVNLYVNDEGLLLTAELPGFDDDSIELTVREDTLTLSGEIAPANDDGRVGWRRRERGRGRFTRTVELPFRIDPDGVDARFHDGVLEIEMRRPEQDKPRRIAINA